MSLYLIRAKFYQTLKGNEPVREWLLTLDVEARKIVGKDIQKVEFGWPIGMPYSRPLGQGLYEFRSDITDQPIFFIKANESPEDTETRFRSCDKS